MPSNQSLDRKKGTSDHGWRQLYPFQSHYLDVDGGRCHYLDEGSGSPLLMVHGNPTWSFYWRNLICALRDRVRTLAPDHLGMGLSEKPQRYRYCLAQHTQNLVEFIRRLDLQGITLVVHDWGGAIGLGAAVAEPSRFARLIITNTGAFPPPFVPLRIRLCRTPWLGTWAVRGLNLFARAAIKMAVERPLDANVAAGLLAPYNDWQHRVGIDRFVGDIPFTPMHTSWQTLANLEENLPTLGDRPIQLIWGMRDWCFRPQCLSQFQTIFPNAEVHQVADAGHYLMEDAPDRVVELVRAFVDDT